MNKLRLLSKLREVYESGGNVLESLKDGAELTNDTESIMISYDFQAGSYTKLSDLNSEYIARYTDGIKTVFLNLGSISTVMEVGVGEATLMNPLMAKIDPNSKFERYGFDISWSRVRYASENSRNSNQPNQFFVANLFEIPLPDNSIDVVYTSHSLEPNGGREREALQELYRVARKFIVLLEPDFDNASPEGRQRMSRHGYVRDLPKFAKQLGYRILESRPFEISINPLNPTGLTVIEKSGVIDVRERMYVCPVTKSRLWRSGGAYFSPESGLIYPVIDDIPCLIANQALLGLHFGKFNCLS
jgi:ubiquinone/menaquinone biosynthesis C-methylase UbiE